MNLPKFDWGNEVLYRMCREYPLHADASIAVGKIWLIGRSYSATIERKAGQKIIKGQDFYLTQVGPKVRDSGIDDWIRSVASIERVTEMNLDSILSCHKRVIDLFRDISGIDKRSLASKYLHFHVPNAFFIFDSIAAKRLTNLQPPTKLTALTEVRDSVYANFCCRCLALRARMEAQSESQITPRELDNYLLSK